MDAAAVAGRELRGRGLEVLANAFALTHAKGDARLLFTEEESEEHDDRGRVGEPQECARPADAKAGSEGHGIRVAPQCKGCATRAGVAPRTTNLERRWKKQASAQARSSGVSDPDPESET